MLKKSDLKTVLSHTSLISEMGSDVIGSVPRDTRIPKFILLPDGETEAQWNRVLGETIAAYAVMKAEEAYQQGVEDGKHEAENQARIERAKSVGQA